MRCWKYIFVLLVLANILLFLAIFKHDDNLHLVFCDVGQGDGILVYRKNIQVVIDGGPDRKILSCLGRHMSFFDRQIEYVVLTNSDLDHYGGLIDIFQRFRVLGYGTSGVQKDDGAFRELVSSIRIENIVPTNIFLGNRMKISSSASESINQENIKFEAVWPPKNIDILRENNYLEGQDVNTNSVVLELEYNRFRALLTGDIVPPATDLMVEVWREMNFANPRADILKVPHHGSKNGLTEALAENTMPSLAVISDGKDNKFGHPHEETLRILGNLGIMILRTDQVGEIEIVTDGENWWVQNPR